MKWKCPMDFIYWNKNILFDVWRWVRALCDDDEHFWRYTARGKNLCRWSMFSHSRFNKILLLIYWLTVHCIDATILSITHLYIVLTWHICQLRNCIFVYGDNHSVLDIVTTSIAYFIHKIWLNFILAYNARYSLSKIPYIKSIFDWNTIIRFKTDKNFWFAQHAIKWDLQYAVCAVYFQPIHWKHQWSFQEGENPQSKRSKFSIHWFSKEFRGSQRLE